MVQNDARKTKSGAKDKTKGKTKGMPQGRSAASDKKSNGAKPEDVRNTPGNQV
ncbi:hypothetical protein [Nonomuraea sp. NPDC050783]|uniref:hypothetical protein n=1 Tax=Nonomuraea sp. NPDC050783 TaxID=3154634 RepID=UPI0034661624